jgi:hypothetical protein
VDPPCSTRVSRDRVYSRAHRLPVTGLSPSLARLSIRFTVPPADPRSLAATDGIAVAFFSCGYLDVSVLHVRSTTPMHSGLGIPKGMGCPIRTPLDHGLFTSSPGLFAGYHVLHRLSTPRHPPCALTLDRTNRTPRTTLRIPSRFTLRPPRRPPAP